MGILKHAFPALAVLAATGAATANPLLVANVGAPGINCVFNATCTITVTDSIGGVAVPGTQGTGRLQSRTFLAEAGAPAQGDGGYEYRLDLTAVSGAGPCVTKLTLDAAPDTPMPYRPDGNYDIFVVTSGGIGSVGISSADASGGAITVTFSDAGVCPGQTSFFFGFANPSTTPVHAGASLTLSDGSSLETDARIP